MTRTNRSERLHYSNNVNSGASEAGEGESRTVGTATTTFRENFLIFDFFYPVEAICVLRCCTAGHRNYPTGLPEGFAGICRAMQSDFRSKVCITN